MLYKLGTTMLDHNYFFPLELDNLDLNLSSILVLFLD